MFLFQPKKYLNYSLKSPGIRHRHGGSKNSSIPPNLPKMSEEEDLSPQGCHTPTSPNQPHSPMGAMTHISDNVFTGDLLV